MPPAVKSSAAASNGGELRANLDPELVLDGLYGPLYLRLLYRHLPLSRLEIEKLVDQLLEGIIASNGHPGA